MNENLKKSLQEQAKRVKSKAVQKYVNGVLMKKIDQAGEAAAAWIEKLETQAENLKPVGAFKEWEDADFKDLVKVLTGGGDMKKEARMAKELVVLARELLAANITVYYSAVDGAKKKKTFSDIAAAREYAQRMIGERPDLEIADRIAKYPDGPPTEEDRKKWREEGKERRKHEGIRPRKKG